MRVRLIATREQTAALSCCTSQVRRSQPLIAMLTQRRGCSTPEQHVHHYRPHDLRGGSRKKIYADAPGTSIKAASAATVNAASSVNLTPESVAPPSPLTADVAVEYMAALRGLHRSLGISHAASRTRWQGREFLQHGMPCKSAAKPQEMWAMTEALACAVVVTCAQFEVGIFECPYGRDSVEFLRAYWQERLLSSSSSSLSLSLCSCEEASLLGRLTMAVLEQLTSRSFRVSAGNRMLLSQLLCEALLPAVVQLLQRDALFMPTDRSGEGGSCMTADQATAFSVLLNTLTKAAAAQWVRREASVDAQEFLFLGMPASLLPPNSDGASCGMHAIQVKVAPLSLPKLSRVLRQYASSVSSLPLRETALPVLRFFTLTQCVPLFVAQQDHDNSSGGDSIQTEEVASLVKSLTSVLQTVLDPGFTSLSHQVANIASIYARILTFRSAANGSSSSISGGGGGDAAIKSPLSWGIFEGVMLGLQENVFHRVEALSPSVVMLHLCERVAPHAKRYLFSDLAALLRALAKIYRVVCRHHDEQLQQLQPVSPVMTDASGMACQVCCGHDVSVAHSRFQRRRSNAPMSPPPRPTTASTMAQAVRKVAPGSHPHSLASLTPYAVSSDDIAEIEGELEVLLDACVAVIERHMLSSCIRRPVLVAQQSGTSLPIADKDNNYNIAGAKTEGLETVGVSRAKALGGKSRLLRRSLSSRELVMIAEGIHVLSWRPFVAFQERLLLALSSEIGQDELEPVQYAHLVCLLLRAPPALPSDIFHAVGDRLKRLIHAEAVTAPTGPEDTNEVIAVAHVRPLQDQALSLNDSCAVVFAFAQKMGESALPLLHDLLVRCGQRVLCDCGTPEACRDSNTVVALTMFVVSATWAIAHAADGRAVSFIAASRDHAACVLAACASGSDAASLSSLMPTIREQAFACMMLEGSGGLYDGGPAVAALRERLQEAYISCAGRCDSVEVARFAAGLFASGPLDVSCDSAETQASGTTLLQFPPWMIAPLRLQERCVRGGRLLAVSFLPLLRSGGSGGVGNDTITSAVTCLLAVVRLHCRTFATLVTTLRLLRATDAALLVNTAVLEVVLRKVTQLTRRTARPLDLFLFFTMYGDCPPVVSACLGELSAEAQCFDSKNAFVPIVQINAAVRAVRRLPSSALRQRWFAAVTPLILHAVAVSWETLDVVLDLVELVGADDPELLQGILRSSASVQAIHETFSFTAPGDTLLRLLLLLQGGNSSHRTVRRLHLAAVKLLQSGKVFLPLDRLAQAMLLPSIEGTTLDRRLKRYFVFRIEKLLRPPRLSSPRAADDHDQKTSAMLTSKEREQQGWDESLNCLELEHWLALLRYSPIGTPSSYRLLMTMKQDRADAARRKGGRTLTTAVETATPRITTATAAAAPPTTQHEHSAFSFLEEHDESANSSGTGESCGRRSRRLSVVYTFSERTILCLRQSLGASRFIVFVSELLRHSSSMASDALFPQPTGACEGPWMYDGSPSPLADERVKPFVRLASCLVEDMSADLGGFLQREHAQQQLHSQRSVGKPLDKEVTLDIGAVLDYVQLLNLYDTPRTEERLLLLSSGAGGDIFDDAVSLPQRHLCRLLLQVPQHWGSTSSVAPASRGGGDGGGDVVRVRLCNISSVFDYCCTPAVCCLPFGTSDMPEGLRRSLSDMFGTNRPLLSDVLLPLSAAQSLQKTLDSAIKRRLLDALMQCVVRDGESPATTRARLATLGPRDLACVVQACVMREAASGGDADAVRHSRKMAAANAVELLTDMLPSTKAEDLHDVVLALLPLTASEAQQQHQQRHLSNAQLQGDTMAEVRRFLAHVAVVMGNDTERFPLPLMLAILRRLHLPHGLVSPAAAQMMLASLHATHDSADQQQQTDDDGKGHLPESGVQAVSKKGHYTATVALLRSIVASSSSSSSQILDTA
ncbi:hypothetical protein DQ04_01871030 [Trypanosoma grayi]|uniref:hypothetical protein n=1 Tax=Trypanosoma grayi TaxID=71804 RepID=UPI0004F446E7|nr:hypothetical protein DQ04_01871030 [Trypanosoma grayi]KEG12235.1 hypothetical protein DQ04_01871030 [Trypanosoma grayi]